MDLGGKSLQKQDPTESPINRPPQRKVRGKDRRRNTKGTTREMDHCVCFHSGEDEGGSITTKEGKEDMGPRKDQKGDQREGTSSRRKKIELQP